MAEENLIFAWFVRERRSASLLMFAIASLLFLTAITLLFQVVYPTTRQRALSPQRILLLDRSSPAARPILDMVSDHDFQLLRTSESDATQLAAHTPVFTPSFKGHVFRARDFIDTSTAAPSVPRLFQPNLVPLPPVPHAKAPTGIPKPSARQSLQPVVIEGFKDRAIMHSMAITDLTFATAGGTSYRIGVNGSGAVEFVLPLQDPASQPETITQFKTIRDQLQQLHFTPAATGALEWGVVQFVWREDQPSSP
jgi:hypothetical protein